MNYSMCIEGYTINLTTGDVNKRLVTNNKLNGELTKWKNKIDNDPSWDQFKKLTNEYEYIFSRNDISNTSSKQSVIKRKPLSRSYFKMWEILHDFKMLSSVPIVTAHLAEGPGGFIESLCDFARKYNLEFEKIYGITLLSTEKKVPNWKLGQLLIKDFPIVVNEINQNTGDLYSIENIDMFVETIGVNKCSFVTADGGFDFSKDFNNQETTFYRLFLCEIYTAICIQKNGGNFLVKVFDLFQEETIKLLACCKIFYKEMHIIKPNTSRPANSEKYIIFKSFTGVDTSEQIQVRDALRNKVIDIDNVLLYIPKNVYDTILDCVTKYNIYYTFRQIHYIRKTLDLVKLKHKQEDVYKKVIYTLTRQHSIYCDKWCKKYNL